MASRQKHFGQDGLEACLSHRCDEHEDLPPVNSNGPNQSECAICVGAAFVEAYEQKFEGEVFWPSIESAKQRLNLLAPGTGDDFVVEVRQRLLAARTDTSDQVPS